MRAFAPSFQGRTSPGNPIVISRSHESNKWRRSLERMPLLHEGWNGYSAPAPSRVAITTAEMFLSSLLTLGLEPTRLAPSAVGGVGITHKKNGHKVYLEFYNSGDVCVLFSDGVAPPQTRRIEPSPSEFLALAREIRVYVDA